MLLSLDMYLDNERRKIWISAEMLVAYKFSAEGYCISKPFSPAAYDIVVDSWSKLYRVQVKVATLFKQRERKLGLGDRDHYYVELAKIRSRKDVPIESTAFDILCMVCGCDVYSIPASLIVRPSDPGLFLRSVHIKPFDEGLTRADSRNAGMKWEPFRNNFKLN